MRHRKEDRPSSGREVGPASDWRRAGFVLNDDKPKAYGSYWKASGTLNVNIALSVLSETITF